MSHAFPFGTVLLVLVGVAVVGFGWWRVQGDAVAARATALYSVAFVGLFIALISGFVLVRSVVADATDATPGHEQMMSQMAGMMSGGMMDGGMMGGHGGMGGSGLMPGMPGGHPGGMMPGMPSSSPSPEAATFSTLASASPSPSPSPSPSAGGMPPGHPAVPGGSMPWMPGGSGMEPGMGGSGMVPGMPGGSGVGGSGGMMGSGAVHQQMMDGHERAQRADATTAALFLVAGLITWWFALGAVRKLGERSEETTYRGLVYAGSVVTLLYGSVVAATGLLHAVAPGMYVDPFLEDLQRRGGIVDLIAGSVLAVASGLLLRSVRGPSAPTAADPAE